VDEMRKPTADDLLAWSFILSLIAIIWGWALFKGGA